MISYGSLFIKSMECNIKQIKDLVEKRNIEQIERVQIQGNINQIKNLVTEQVNNERLWTRPKTEAEVHTQLELRRLQVLIGELL